MRANTSIRKNSSWEKWGINGFISGFLLVIIGIFTQILEIPRVYNGMTNVNIMNNMTDDLYLISNYYNHWWPWTYAANLFGLCTFLTGIAGILAGVRRSYTSIFVFFTMSVVSALFSIYLIIYFAYIIAFYRSNGEDKLSNRTQPESVSYSLACTQLVIAILNTLISTLSAILAGRAIALCVRKGIAEDDIIKIPTSRTPQLPRAAYQRQ
jgi:uncharacterized membrane protein